MDLVQHLFIGHGRKLMLCSRDIFWTTKGETALSSNTVNSLNTVWEKRIVSKIKSTNIYQCLGLNTEMPLWESSLNQAFCEKQKDAITVFLKNRLLITLLQINCFEPHQYIAHFEISLSGLPGFSDHWLLLSKLSFWPGPSPLVTRTRTLTHLCPVQRVTFSALCNQVKLPTNYASL